MLELKLPEVKIHKIHNRKTTLQNKAQKLQLDISAYRRKSANFLVRYRHKSTDFLELRLLRTWRVVPAKRNVGLVEAGELMCVAKLREGLHF